MKLVSKISIIIVFIIPVFIGACKKQMTCGCDKDVLHSLEGSQVMIQFDEENKSAQFTPLSNQYATYYFCNPTTMMDKLTKFTNGDIVLIDGEAYYECNYMQQASNSPYYSGMYQAYMITVFDVREDLYGK